MSILAVPPTEQQMDDGDFEGSLDSRINAARKKLRDAIQNLTAIDRDLDIYDEEELADAESQLERVDSILGA